MSLSRFALLLLVLGVLLPLGTAQAAPFVPGPEEYWIKVDKSRLRLYLIQGKDTLVKSYPVAVGRGVGDVKKDRLDLITPEGVFKVRRVLQDASQLVYDPAWFDEPGEPQKGVYGSKLISFYNPWQIAIHGTNSPRSVGRRTTHGCIRMKNRDINTLVAYVKPGMKIWIVGKDGKAPPGGKTAPPGTPDLEPGVERDTL